MAYSHPSDVLKYGFWNIEGYNSKVIGNKLVHKDLLQEIGNQHIVGLAETHIHNQTLENLSIPGFTRIHYSIREPNSKGKGSGGIALFCKHHISKYVTAITKNNKDVIWVKIGKELCGVDVFLCTIYYSPIGNKAQISKQFQILSDEILGFQNKGEVILQGDLNAHTSIKEDIISGNSFHPDVENGENFILPPRNSEDSSATNIRGEELLELCKAHDLVILNGRKTGDPWGKITSYQWNGTAVVDYVISSHGLLKDITCFRVGDYSPWISDHCPLLFEMALIKSPREEKKEKLEELPKTFHLSPEDRQKFVETLKTPEIAERLTLLSSSGNTGAQVLTAKITDLLIEICDKAEIKPKKVKQGDKIDEPWFDKECKDLKDSIKRDCRKLRKNPKDKVLNASILKDNKSLKKLIKRKKEDYRLAIIKDMNLKRRDQKLFWKLLEKLRSQNTDIFKRHISPKRWTEHFKSVLVNEDREPNYPPDSHENGPLDYPIEKEELDKASYVLKPNKSSGYDSVSNEMILGLLEVKPDLIIMLFNEVLTSNSKIDHWSVGMIVPIFKSGVRMDPNNYRGISLLSCLGKLFTSILNQRLLQYVIQNNILSKEQLGFIAGNRTSDAHVILHNLQQLYCHKRGKKIYSCFVDFSKAFDSIPRDTLFTKLAKIGISGKFFNTLKTIYKHDTCRIKLDDGLTKPFVSNQGVKQGCILSPLLFNIFLADLPSKLDGDQCHPLTVHESHSIGCLVWADDIILLSETEEGLQHMLNLLAQYTKENGMRINTAKTKGMIFNKSGKFFRRSFEFNSEKIFTTNSYKYLGFIVTPSGEISSGLKDLKDRALRAYFKLKKSMGHYFRLHPTITLQLFDTLIKPILLYNSDFWGCLKIPLSNPIENTHMRFCKDLLGVQKQTSNIGVLLELGRTPIMLYGKKNCIKNWGRIHIQGSANKILLWSHLNSVANELRWNLSVTNCLNYMGIGEDTRDNFVHMEAIKRMADIFHQEAFAEINRDRSKLRTYAKIKTEQGYENYLSIIKNVNQRTAVTKLRLSNHDLMIEKGRHLRLEINQRNCPLCPGNLLEDEFHLLLTCKTFSFIRNDLLSVVEDIIPRFIYLSKEEKLKTLLCDDKLINFTGIFLHKALELRRFLVNEHKNTI